MLNQGRSTRAVLPIVGTAAVVTAGGGALATVAAAAPAAPDAGGVAGDLVLGVGGTFESCEAFFGFGKEFVAFDVVDQNGADGVAHAVPDDTQVVFVAENEGGDQLECTPVELTQEVWDDFFANEGPFAGIPPFPGPGYYIYPSIENGTFIEDDDFGEVTSAGFRVVDIPAEHTLVSPTGTVELQQFQLNGPDLLFLFVTDPRISALITADPDAGETAADAWEAAVAACDADSNSQLGGEALVDAVAVLEALVGQDMGDLECGDIQFLNFNASTILGLQESIAYTETITLAVPEAGTTTTTTIATTTTTAAVSPTSVLARTGPGRSSSAPMAFVGALSIAGGALVLVARRHVRDAR